MSVLERCPPYRESNKGSKERQGPTLSVHFTEVSVKRESIVFIKYVEKGHIFAHATETRNVSQRASQSSGIEIKG